MDLLNVPELLIEISQDVFREELLIIDERLILISVDLGRLRSRLLLCDDFC